MCVTGCTFEVTLSVTITILNMENKFKERENLGLTALDNCSCL